MKEAGAENSGAVDRIQQRLSDYASNLKYSDLSAEAIRAAKIRITDTLGALIGGLSGEPCVIARKLAAQASIANGVAIIGSRVRTTPDMAAFANGTAARYVEMNDAYHVSGRRGGHPSDIIMPTLAAAEHGHVNGRQFITGVAVGYESYLRMIDAIEIPGFDYTNYVCLGSAIGAGKVLGLSSSQLSHCIALAVVPNNSLRQGAIGHLSMWKVMASGQAGRAGVFAALLAREGVHGPSFPFEGKEGWCNQISRKAFSLGAMGGEASSFKVQDTIIKLRPARYVTIPAILAAEKIAPLSDPDNILEVVVEMFKRAVDGTGEHHWNPQSRETANHSIPFVVAAVLLDGTATPRTFDDAHLGDKKLRCLMKIVRMEENKAFTAAHERLSKHYARVTVVKRDGSSITGMSGGEHGDLSDHVTEEQIEHKFTRLAESVLDAGQIKSTLSRLRNLEEIDDVGELSSGMML